MTTAEGLPDEETIQRKLLQASRLYDFAFTLKKTQVERQHPEWPEEKVHHHVIELIDAGSN